MNENTLAEKTVTHTPGPWHIEEGRNVSDARGWLVARVSMEAPRTADEADVNAGLIAAAPDLLYALKLLRTLTRHSIVCEARIERGDWECNCGLNDYLDKATAAIAKANGGAK